MENLFDINNVRGFMGSSLDVMTRWQELAKTIVDAQVAAMQKTAVETLNRAFDTAREAQKVGETTMKLWVEQARHFPTMPQA